MKKHVFSWTVILLSFFYQNLFAQSQIKYNYKVYDLNQRPKAGVRVTLVETTTFDYMVFYTNQNGIAEIRINSGEEWSLNVGQMKGVEVLKMPEDGTSEFDSEIALDPEMWEMNHSPEVDKSDIAFTEIKQNLPRDYVAQGTNCLVSVVLKDRQSNPWANIMINLISPSKRTTTSVYTDGRGIARLEVPAGAYQLDVDGEHGFDQIGIPSDTNQMELSYLFTRKDFSEHVDVAGNTVQRLNEFQNKVSNRVYFELMVTKQDGNPYHEKVLIRTANSNEKYIGYTDQHGQVNFMLPKGHVYSVNFEFQENASTIDLTPMETTGSLRTTVPYIPDERLAHPERYLPTKDELKVFDLNNVLTEQYSDTPDDHLVNFHAKWGTRQIGSGSKEAVLEMGFSVKSGTEAKAVNKPVNLIFVLDKSGSMSFERIDFLKYAMAQMIEELRPEDKASIVVFDTQAAIAYPLMAADQNRLKDVVYALQADGGTSIYEGLKLGYKNMNAAYDSKATNRMILLTDGYGSKPVDEILTMSKKYFDKGMALSTIGIGSGYNHNLLNLLSQYSGGLAHQAFGNKDIQSAFVKEFESVMYPLASNLRVTVTYNNKIVYKTLHGIPEIEHGKDYVNFRIPSVFASMNQTALMKFKLDNPTPSISDQPIIIKVNYFDEQKGQPVELVKEMNLEWTEETDLELVSTEQQKRIYSLAVINQCNKVIADLCDNKNYEAAEKQVKEALKALKRTNDNKFSEDFMPYIKQLEDYLTAIKSAMKRTPKGEDIVSKME